MSRDLAGLDPVASLILRRSLEGESIELPSQREILLLRTKVAGTFFHAATEAVPTLAQGQRLRLQLEPQNPHDELAIEVIALSGHKLGYVPRRENAVLARLMDAGKLMLARVVDVVPDDHGPEIGIEILLCDL